MAPAQSRETRAARGDRRRKVGLISRGMRHDKHTVAAVVVAGASVSGLVYVPHGRTICLRSTPQTPMYSSKSSQSKPSPDAEMPKALRCPGVAASSLGNHVHRMRRKRPSSNATAKLCRQTAGQLRTTLPDMRQRFPLVLAETALETLIDVTVRSPGCPVIARSLASPHLSRQSRGG
ncbi:hypothetical protein SAMN05192563_101558 [Paraburkholderia aspalathi]|uniref:Uncharacterized protein n=1 Tax=Paraburkholderia aspalathi TaxID=1324617 RepID=A0A1I7E9J3_9BURK|nr:hypothetical protein SAMN05192563_101558 [Paraburkholderia aspalathi]